MCAGGWSSAVGNVVNTVGRGERGLYLVPALTLLAVLGFMSLDPRGIASGLRDTGFDFAQRLAPRAAPADTPVHLVEIDQASLDRLGEWPWPRTRLAELVAAAETGGARAVLLDQPLTRPDPTSPTTVAAHHNRLAFYLPEGDLPNHDAMLADMLSHAKAAIPVGVAPAPESAPDGNSGPAWPRETIADETGLAAFARAITIDRAPLRPIGDKVRTLGFDSVRLDPGAVQRRLPLVARVGDGLAPADLTAVLNLADGSPGYSLSADGTPDTVSVFLTTGLSAVGIAERAVPVTPEGALSFYGRDPSALPRLSAIELLEDRTARADLKDSIVVIAPTAPDTAARFATPAQGRLTAGEIKALALEQIASDTFLVRPRWASLAEQLVLVVGGIAMIAIVMAGHAGIAALAGIGAAVAMVGGSWIAFTASHMLLDGVVTGLGLLVVAASLSWIRLRAIASHTRHLLSAVGGKLPTPAVSTLSASRGNALTGQLRKITVMFCDIRGYGAFSELHRDDPQWMAYLLQRFHGYVADQILETGGVADTHQGTAVMGFWNAPVDDPDHARKACDCALKLIEGLDTLNRELELEAETKSRAFLPLHLAIGINTGHSLVGNLGSARQVDYTALGDPVAIARRLEGYSEVYGPAVIVGEHTYNAVKNRYALLELDKVAVEGRDYAVRTFALLGNPVVRANPRFRALEQAQSGILEAYRARDWATARRRIDETRAMKSAIPSLYDFYERRIDFYRANPPGPDWDGVFRPPIQ